MYSLYKYKYDKYVSKLKQLSDTQPPEQNPWSSGTSGKTGSYTPKNQKAQSLEQNPWLSGTSGKTGSYTPKTRGSWKKTGNTMQGQTSQDSWRQAGDTARRQGTWTKAQDKQANCHIKPTSRDCLTCFTKTISGMKDKYSEFDKTPMYKPGLLKIDGIADENAVLKSIQDLVLSLLKQDKHTTPLEQSEFAAKLGQDDYFRDGIKRIMEIPNLTTRYTYYLLLCKQLEFSSWLVYKPFFGVTLYVKGDYVKPSFVSLKGTDIYNYNLNTPKYPHVTVAMVNTERREKLLEKNKYLAAIETIYLAFNWIQFLYRAGCLDNIDLSRDGVKYSDISLCFKIGDIIRINKGKTKSLSRHTSLVCNEGVNLYDFHGSHNSSAFYKDKSKSNIMLKPPGFKQIHIKDVSNVCDKVGNTTLGKNMISTMVYKKVTCEYIAGSTDSIKAMGFETEILLR